MDKMTTTVMTPRIGGGGCGNVVPVWDNAGAEALTPRMTPRTPVVNQQLCQPVSMTPRVPLGSVNMSNSQSIQPATAAPAQASITPAQMCEFSQKGGAAGAASVAYLTKKLVNLTRLLEQDTRGSDHIYPRFSC